MSLQLNFKRRAAAEIEDAFAWCDQTAIRQGGVFFAEIERVERFIRLNPLMYPEVASGIRRANFRRLPYSLFEVVDGDVINVLSCFHQHRDPEVRPVADEA